jgi:hypothetical protein
LQAAETEISAEDFCLEAENVAKDRSQEAFEQLVAMYKQSTDRKQLKCLAEYLSQANPDGANDFFISTLQDKDKNIRARAAYGLSITKDRRAVEPLHKVFQDPDSGIKCNVAYALGAIKDPSSLLLLIPELESEYPNKRRCIIKALRAYNDPKNCQKFYEMWMNDTDQVVQIEAGISVVNGSCENEITRSTEYNIPAESCEVAQGFIDKTAEAIVKYPSKKEWSRNVDFGINPNEINTDKPDESTMMKVNLMMGAADWGESVDNFYGKKDWGSLEENQNHYFLDIVDYRRKEEALKYLCPNITFPNFSYWNKLIQNSTK